MYKRQTCDIHRCQGESASNRHSHSVGLVPRGRRLTNPSTGIVSAPSNATGARICHSVMPAARQVQICLGSRLATSMPASSNQIRCGSHARRREFT
jgi:hypothetical protein